MKNNTEKAALSEYLSLMESGMFGELYPKLSWSWDLDREWWLVEYTRLERMKKKFKRASVFESE